MNHITHLSMLRRNLLATMAFLLGAGLMVKAQVITTEVGTNYTAGNTAGAVDSYVTFNVSNTSGGPINITGLDCVLGTANNNTSCQLYVSLTSLDGTPHPITGPTWTVIAGPTPPVPGPGTGIYPPSSPASPI